MGTPSPETGDLGLAHSNGTVARLIRLVERIRRARRGQDPSGVWANHVVVYVGAGKIVEARPTINPFRVQGVVISPIGGLGEVRWSTGKALGASGGHIAEQALTMVGIPYAFLDIIAFLFVLVGIDPKWLRRRLNRPDRLFCSQVAARAIRGARQAEALEHGVPLASVLGSDLGIVPGVPDSEQTPDDIDLWLGTIKEGA